MKIDFRGHIQHDGDILTRVDKFPWYPVKLNNRANSNESRNPKKRACGREDKCKNKKSGKSIVDVAAPTVPEVFVLGRLFCSVAPNGLLGFCYLCLMGQSSRRGWAIAGKGRNIVSGNRSFGDGCGLVTNRSSKENTESSGSGHSGTFVPRVVHHVDCLVFHNLWRFIADAIAIGS